MGDSEEVSGPEWDVWYHLASGLDEATSEFRVFGEKDQAMLDLLGEAVFHVRSRLTTRVASRAPETLAQIYGEEWVRHAIDLRIAEEAIDRAREGFDRYAEIEPAVITRPLGDRSARYLRQAAMSYVFGFDGPCIAFCGAALEQLLKEHLVEAGCVSEKEIQRRKLSGGEALDQARREGLISSTSMQASRILHERNRVMHRHLWDERIIRQMALQSLKDLTEVLGELDS